MSLSMMNSGSRIGQVLTIDGYGLEEKDRVMVTCRLRLWSSPRCLIRRLFKASRPSDKRQTTIGDAMGSFEVQVAMATCSVKSET